MSWIKHRTREAERQAIEQLLVNVTPPIIVQDKDRFGIVGTATLFTIQERPFLITAGHLIVDYSVNRWAYSEHPGGGPIHTLGALNHYRPNNEQYDVAVVEILDPGPPRGQRVRFHRRPLRPKNRYQETSKISAVRAHCN
jgi:hypothetical protein